MIARLRPSPSTVYADSLMAGIRFKTTVAPIGKSAATLEIEPLLSFLLLSFGHLISSINSPRDCFKRKLFRLDAGKAGMKLNSAMRDLEDYVFVRLGAAFRHTRKSIQLIFGCCALIFVPVGYSASPQTSGLYPSSLRVEVDRTVPRVEPPRAGLEFSASPTEEEIFRAHVFMEPLVVVGSKPTAKETSELATALLRYARRAGPDDFSALTDFLKEHPRSSWTAALLTDLGLEYYNTAHYSKAIEAWLRRGWSL